MSLFRIENNERLQNVKELPFKLEKEIQSLTENNLKGIFGLEFVISEFGLYSFRTDSVADDRDAKCYVIIE